MVKKLLKALRAPVSAEESAPPGPEAERAAVLVQASGETIVVLDGGDHVVAATPKALSRIEGLAVGLPAPLEVLHAANRVEYEAGGRVETLVRLPEAELSAYEELRSGFTAVVSHELRTPLARLLALLETALLADSDSNQLVEQARVEVEQIRELIDEVLFLSELETGREVVSLSSTPALPVLEQVLAGFEEAARRADVTLRAEGDSQVELPLRPRMLRVVAENLTENALRYAGPGATFRLSVEREDDRPLLRAVDDGAGVPEEEVGRLFERFYRADRARTSRGTGLGLAIVKHIVTSAGGTIEASSPENGGLEIRALFPPA